MNVIFYADDDPDDIAVFNMVLQDIYPSAELIPIRNGQNLISYIHQFTPPNPEIIFLDINMPELNGFQVMNELINSSLYKEVPVVILSGSNRPEDIDRMLKSGATAFIKKPGSYSDFHRVISEVFKDLSMKTARPKERFVYQ